MPIPDAARCMGCGYALRGLPRNICPECGRAFDPGDPTTYRMPDKSASWRRLARAPSWKLQSLIVVIALLVVEADCASGHVILMGTAFPCMLTPCALLLGSGIGLCVTVGDYLRRLRAVYLDRDRAALDGDAPARSSRTGWITLPVCLLVIVSVFATDWPLHVRFELSRPAFERELASVLRANASATQPTRVGGSHRVGLYLVDRIYFDPGRRVHFCTGGGWDSFGFVYDLTAPPVSRRGFGLQPPWRTFYWAK